MKRYSVDPDYWHRAISESVDGEYVLYEDHCEAMKRVSMNDTHKAGEREALILAAVNCPHEIDHNSVVLHYDDKQPGHNALAQLGDRLSAALDQPAAGVTEPCKFCGNVENNGQLPPPEYTKGWADAMEERALAQGVLENEALLALCERIEENADRQPIWVDYSAAAAIRAALAQPAAGAEPDGYGETDFGYTFAGITLTDGDKRLMTMLVKALGTDHPAIDDMTSLLFRAAPAAPVDQPKRKPLEAFATVAEWAQQNAAQAPMLPPTLPKSLLSTICNYGMARTDGVNELECQHRWLTLIDGIKAYAVDHARTVAQAPSASAPTQCKSCGGNDADIPCAYPGKHERQPHCLRTTPSAAPVAMTDERPAAKYALQAVSRLRDEIKQALDIIDKRHGACGATEAIHDKADAIVSILLAATPAQASAESGAQGVTDARKLANFDGMLTDLRAAIEDRDYARAEVKRRDNLANGTVWYWQGDGTDNLESLTCDVVIRADDLRAMLAQRDGGEEA